MLTHLPKDIELWSARAPCEASSLAPEHSKQREQQMQRPWGANKLVVFLEQKSSQCGWSGVAEEWSRGGQREKLRGRGSVSKGRSLGLV